MLSSEVNRRLDVQFELVTPIALGAQRSAALSFLRRRRLLTERDRLVVNLFQRHLQRAYENASLPTPPLRLQASHRSLRTRWAWPAEESDVAFWITHGKTNWEIGVIPRISARTVEKHVESVLRKLRVENRTTAALRLRERPAGITPEPRPLPAT